MDTVAGFRQVAARLRAEGVKVEEVPGWETRGKGTLRPKGYINHHTASSRAGSTAVSLNIVTFGRPDLRNAVCNWFIARDGTAYLVAARQAWHAGQGSVPGLAGNADLIGVEADNDGRGEPWADESLRTQAALNRACAEVFDFPYDRLLDHKEWAPGRKIDRAGIDPDAWRAQVAAKQHGEHETIEENDVQILFTPVHKTVGQLKAGVGHGYVTMHNGTSRWVATAGHYKHLASLGPTSGFKDVGQVGDDWFFVWPPTSGPHLEEYGRK